jgi:uncharacterized membrane protein
MWLLRTLMLLALTVWIGGIIFFAFVLAPALFQVLPAHLAGDVVNRSLSTLHWIGIVSAGVFLVCSLLYDRVRYARFRPFTLINVLAVLMLAFTLLSQFAISPQIGALRAELSRTGQPVVTEDFNRWHRRSEQAEGCVLLLGLVVVALTARRFGESSR